MGFHNGFGNIKSEPQAGFVQSTAFIAFIESVKNERKILFGNARAFVVNRNGYFVLFRFRNADPQNTARARIFNGIVAEIVENLIDCVVVGVRGHSIFFAIKLHPQTFLLDWLLEGKKNLSAHLANVKPAHYKIALAGLNAGDIQQRGNQAGKPPDFGLDNAEIVILFFRRDNAGADLLDKPADRCHGRSQIVRNVGNERRPHFFQIFKRIGHIVKRFGKPGNLVPAPNADARIEIPFRKPIHRNAHFPKRRNDPRTDEIHGDHSGNQHQHCRGEDRLDHLLAHQTAVQPRNANDHGAAILPAEITNGFHARRHRAGKQRQLHRLHRLFTFLGRLIQFPGKKKRFSGRRFCRIKPNHGKHFPVCVGNNNGNILIPSRQGGQKLGKRHLRVFDGGLKLLLKIRRGAIGRKVGDHVLQSAGRAVHFPYFGAGNIVVDD